MSRSNPTLQNPAQHFFEWSGSTGQLQFYDKEKAERINVPLPFEFLVLDELATITGFDKAANNRFYSNEVRNTQKEELTVRSKGAVRYVGLYKNEQGIVQMPRGASYAQSIYIAHKTRSGEYIIGNIKASGSARSAWFDFSKTVKVQNGKVVMTKGDVQHAKTGDFYPPVFKYVSSTPQEDSEAVRLDTELQIYLNQYLTAPKYDEAGEPVSEEYGHTTDDKATPEQVADFERRKAEKFADKQEDEEIKSLNTAYQQFDDQPINLDDIPY